MEDSKALIYYRRLAEEFAGAKQAVKTISDITAEVSRCLTTEPYRMTFSSTGMDIPLRPDFAGKPLVCSPETWPTAETLAEAVNRLYLKEKALRQAWANLSSEEQKLVEPPPGISR